MIPVAGDFCTICNQFYMIDTEPSDMCAHVRSAKVNRCLYTLQSYCLRYSLTLKCIL